jgi:pyruvate/2-oxoglutarate dehydrogenase complex dihydrolipoamide acyltransferase (E2) component
MPETRGERIIFGIGALAIAAIVALIVLETTDRFETRDAPAAARPATTPAATTEAAAPAPAPATTAPVTTTAPETTTGEMTAASEPAPRAASDVRLRLSATADTWVEIRSGSADGDVLYSGILPQGTAKRFRSTQLWASFGAASNLTARLNGKPLHLPPGTYSALVGARDLRRLGG